jgi:hypothetical protein
MQNIATKLLAPALLCACLALHFTVLNARTDGSTPATLASASFGWPTGISDNPLAGKWQLTHVVYKDHSPEADEPGLAWMEALKMKLVFSVSADGIMTFPTAIYAQPAHVSIEGNEVVLKWTGGNASLHSDGKTSQASNATSATYFGLELKGNTMVWRYDSPNVQQVFTFKRL